MLQHQGPRLAAVRDAIVTALNNDSSTSGLVTASAGVAEGEILLTSRTPGTG